MFNLSSGEGPRFAELAVEMTNKVKELGPNPLKTAKRKMAA
jgi:F420-non-reducing hydrogenase iron-sulfur subunit